MGLNERSLVFGLATVFAAIAVASTANAQTMAFQRSVSVTGNCLRAVQPDRGSLVVTADVQAQDLQTAAKKSTETYERVKKAVQKLGLKDLELTTSEYNFQEVREWQKDRNVFKGFRARMGLSVSTSEISRLGEVIALAANEGVRDVSSLNTFLSLEKSKIEREACLEDAVKNARSKAETIARAASSKLGRVLAVSESGAAPMPPPAPMFKAAMRGMAEDASVAAPGVDAGPQRISIDVSVTFGLD